MNMKLYFVQNLNAVQRKPCISIFDDSEFLQINRPAFGD